MKKSSKVSAKNELNLNEFCTSRTCNRCQARESGYGSGSHDCYLELLLFQKSACRNMLTEYLLKKKLQFERSVEESKSK